MANRTCIICEKSKDIKKFTTFELKTGNPICSECKEKKLRYKPKTIAKTCPTCGKSVRNPELFLTCPYCRYKKLSAKKKTTQ